MSKVKAIICAAILSGFVSSQAFAVSFGSGNGNGNGNVGIVNGNGNGNANTGAFNGNGNGNFNSGSTVTSTATPASPTAI